MPKDTHNTLIYKYFAVYLGMIQVSKTHCKRGHAFTPENTIRERNGSRCRTCKNDRQRAKAPLPSLSMVELFWSRVEKSDGCWTYAADPRQRYPRVHITHTTTVKASRFSYELAFGAIPGGLLVCHKCDTPRCVNPAHLFLGTASDNMQDKIKKGRGHEQLKTHCKNGHEFTPENTRMVRGIHRGCRICLRLQSNSNKARHTGMDKRTSHKIKK